jgi:hypothetical protein
MWALLVLGPGVHRQGDSDRVVAVGFESGFAGAPGAVLLGERDRDWSGVHSLGGRLRRRVVAARGHGKSER